MSLNTKEPFLMSYLEMFINFQIYGFGGGTLHGNGILVPSPGLEPVYPEKEVQILNYWTTREVPMKQSFKGA